MPLNDDTEDEFAAKIEDEDGSIYPVPATELVSMVGMKIARDRGSGSYAEDGPQEIGMEDEIGVDGMNVGAANAADRIAAEIGAGDRFEAEIGSAAMYGPSEIGSNAMYGPSEIGSNAMYGPTEIGDVMKPSHMTPFESFMEEPVRIGDGFTPYEIGSDPIGEHSLVMRDPETGNYEIGSAAMYGPSEIGAAVMKVVEKARDNRQPPPPMVAVDPEAPPMNDDDWGVMDVTLGAAAETGADQFPLFSALMQRCGATTEPRLVRVDTEESYKQFRTEHSPEMSELAEKVNEVDHKLSQHIADPAAHDDLADDIADLTEVGELVGAAEAEKRVELWMPKRFDGLVTAWREGDFVCASFQLPGADGEVRICTSLEPIRKCVEEMSRHAAEANVPASTVVGMLPAMGCVLGAGTVLKEMAAAAPSILQRPEAAGKAPFVVRIEPKGNPAICALAMLAMACRAGDKQACAEWAKLGELSPGPVKQAMLEAVQLAKVSQ